MIDYQTIPTPKEQELLSLVKYSKAYPDWLRFLITCIDEAIESGIDVVPVWKWLLEYDNEKK